MKKIFNFLKLKIDYDEKSVNGALSDASWKKKSCLNHGNTLIK